MSFDCGFLYDYLVFDIHNKKRFKQHAENLQMSEKRLAVLVNDSDYATQEEFIRISKYLKNKKKFYNKNFK